MPNRIALTEQQKARLYDQLIKSDVIRFRKGPRVVNGQMVEKTYIEHGATREIIVVIE